MGIMGVLFNPQGRIQANQFWKAIIILVAFQIVMQVVQYLGVDLSSITGFLSLALIYPYLCVYGKRLHDSNKSAWMFLLFLLGYIVTSIVSLFFIPGLGEFFQELIVLVEAGDEEAIDVLAEEFGASAGISIQIIGLVGLLVSNLLLGFIVARMHSDPNVNKYGPPVGEAVIGDEDANDIFS